jgi:transposase
MAFKILRKNCCGLDIHKTWIFACIGITDSNGRTEYKQARFSSFSNGLRDLADWLAKYSCSDVCMESTGKYWIPVFNILEKTCWVTLAHPKYTKPQKEKGRKNTAAGTAGKNDMEEGLNLTRRPVRP